MPKKAKPKPTRADVAAAEKKLAETLRKLRAVKRGLPPDEAERDAERERQRKMKREATSSTKNVEIPKLSASNRRRRLRYERDDAAWLRYYFGKLSGCAYPFWYAFTMQQRVMIDGIGHAARWGGDQSIAASRGEGKTTIFERLLTKYILEGRIAFGVLCAATGAHAAGSLETIKAAIESNARLLADYPEVCIPVRALENTPNRAHYQTVSGWRFDNGEQFDRSPSKFSWCGQEIVLPDVPGSPSASAIIATRGLDAAVRGLKKKDRRVDLVGIDDPDTEDTARSEDQAEKLETRIDRALGGLGGQQRAVGRVMLTTLQNRICVGYKFTDPIQKPTWQGKRFRFLVKPPKRLELWQEYMHLRRVGLQARNDKGEALDPFARKAHKFYLSNRMAMDLGAEVANPHRFDNAKLPDRSRLEVSALQRYYNEVVRIGPEAVACEYDNDPPEETGIVESGITPHRIQRQVSGVARRRIPDDCTMVTQGVDVRKIALHWVVRAWRPEEKETWTGFTIDYGVTETNVQRGAAESAVDSAIIRALHDRREYVAENPYMTGDGQIIEPEYSLVDSGWRTETIYQFCDEAGLGWYPAQGHGKSSGCVAVSFRAPTQSTPTKLIGWGYYLAARPGSGGAAWLVHMDSDHWKAWEHDRWMSDPQKPSGLFMWGETSGNPDRMSLDERAHHSYARHICAEIEVEAPDKNGIMKRYWKAKSDNNHWLDASYRCDVAAAMAGVRLFGMPLPEVVDKEDDYTGPIISFKR